MTRISIIVPVFNASGYLKRCIESFFAQTLKEWELVIVDDGSSDDTLKIASNYNRIDKRVKVVSYGSNKGPMYARVYGCSIASGEFITFCDGDDSLPDYALELLYNTAKKENVDIVVGQFLQVFEDGTVSSFPIKASLNYGTDNVSFLKSILRFEMPQGVCGKLFRRSIVDIETIVFEKATMGEDAGILFQYVDRIESAHILDDVVYNYFQNSGSSTHTTISKSALDGICRLLSLRESIVKKYDSLSLDFSRYVIKCLIPLFPHYNTDGYLVSLLKKYELENYVTISNIMQSFPFGQSMIFIAYRYFYPKLYSIFSKIRVKWM